MKKLLKTVICLCLCAAIAAVAMPRVAVREVSAISQSDVTKLQNDKKSTQQKLSGYKSELTNLKNERADQLSIKMNLENQLLLLEEEMLTTERLIEAYESMYEVKNTRKTALEVQTESNYRSFKDAFRYNYMYGQYTDFELLFSSERLFDFLSNDEYSNRIFNYDKELLEKLDENTKELGELADEINVLLTEQKDYMDELEEMKNDTESTQKEVESLISEIDQQIKENEDLINKANNELAAMDKQIKNMLALIAAQSKASYVGGSMLFPIPLASYSRVSSNYGYRTHPVTGKKMSFHTGVDLPAAKNTKIFAANSGTVILAKYYGGYGNCVMIDHGGGIVTVYGHCNSLAVKEGQQVLAGDVIGYVGTTGSSTGYHLHFEVRVKGSHVDPIKNGYLVLPK